MQRKKASKSKFKRASIRILIGIGILTFMLIMGVIGLLFGTLYGYVEDA